MQKHYTIKISGRVQGVYFRAFTKEQAESLNLHGFVRNEPDGSVYAEAEGDEENLQKFLAWCNRGPQGARVEQCQVEEGALKGYTGFVIKR